MIKNKIESEDVPWDPQTCLFIIEDLRDNNWTNGMKERGKIPVTCTIKGWMSHADDHRKLLCLDHQYQKRCKYYTEKVNLPD